MSQDIAIGLGDNAPFVDFILPFNPMGGRIVLVLEARGLEIERTSDDGDIVLSETADPSVWRARWLPSPADTARLPVGRLARYRLRRVVPDGEVRYYADGYVAVTKGAVDPSAVKVAVPGPQGPAGVLPRREGWVAGTLYPATTILTHANAVWFALRPTMVEPSVSATDDWQVWIDAAGVPEALTAAQDALAAATDLINQLVPPGSRSRRQLVAQMGIDGLLTAFLSGDGGLAYTAEGVPADAATIEWEGGGPYAQSGDVYARIQSSAGLSGPQMTDFWTAAGLLPR